MRDWVTGEGARARAKEAIHEAFEDVPRIADDAVAHPATARWRAMYGDRYEGVEIERLFLGRDWRDVDLPLLRHRLGGFQQGFTAFLSDAALAYHTPGFLLMLADEMRDADILFDEVLDVLTLPEGEGSRGAARFRRVYGGYDLRRRRAVATCLAEMEAEEVALDGSGAWSHAGRALMSHWHLDLWP